MKQAVRYTMPFLFFIPARGEHCLAQKSVHVRQGVSCAHLDLIPPDTYGMREVAGAASSDWMSDVYRWPSGNLKYYPALFSFLDSEPIDQGRN